MIDDNDIRWAFLRFQLESEVLLQFSQE